MLLNFWVENYKSFKDLAQVSLVAEKTPKEREEANTFLYSERSENRLLKNLVIYGKNASGKSNLFKAIRHMKEIVLRSYADEPVYNLYVEKCLVNEDSINEPTIFEAEFYIKEKQRTYRYGFKVDTNYIVGEWLYKKEQRETLLFERTSEDANAIELKGEFNKDEIRMFKGATRKNALFLSVLSQWNNEVSKEIIGWFKNLNVITAEEIHPHITYDLYEKDVIKKSEILDFLTEADLDIEDFEVEFNKVNELEIPDFLKGMLLQSVDGKDKSLNEVRSVSTKTYHSVYNGEGEKVSNISFDLNQNESLGTVKMFALAGPLVAALKNDGVILIDEIDARLHFDLTQHIVNKFNSTQNRSAQLLVNTHNPLIITNEKVRKDQIAFVDKNEYGESEFYKLSDFKHLRNDKNVIFKKYLLGQFGGVPEIET